MLDMRSNTVTLCCILENIVCVHVCMHVHCMRTCMFEAVTVVMLCHCTNTCDNSEEWSALYGWYGCDFIMPLELYYATFTV